MHLASTTCILSSEILNKLDNGSVHQKASVEPWRWRTRPLGTRKAWGSGMSALPSLHFLYNFLIAVSLNGFLRSVPSIFPSVEAASDRNSVFVEQVVIADVNVDCRCWLITAWTDSKVIFLQNYHDFSELILKNWLRHLFLLFTSMSSRAVINNRITFVETILCNGGIIENFCFFW